MERFKVSEKKYVLKLEDSARSFKYYMYRDSLINGEITWLEGIITDRTQGCMVLIDQEELESVINFVLTMRGVQ